MFIWLLPFLKCWQITEIYFLEKCAGYLKQVCRIDLGCSCQFATFAWEANVKTIFAFLQQKNVTENTPKANNHRMPLFCPVISHCKPCSQTCFGLSSLSLPGSLAKLILHSAYLVLISDFWPVRTKTSWVARRGSLMVMNQVPLKHYASGTREQQAGEEKRNFMNPFSSLMWSRTFSWSSVVLSTSFASFSSVKWSRI